MNNIKTHIMGNLIRKQKKQLSYQDLISVEKTYLSLFSNVNLPIQIVKIIIDFFSDKNVTIVCRNTHLGVRTNQYVLNIICDDRIYNISSKHFNAFEFCETIKIFIINDHIVMYHVHCPYDSRATYFQIKANLQGISVKCVETFSELRLRDAVSICNHFNAFFIIGGYKNFTPCKKVYKIINNKFYRMKDMHYKRMHSMSIFDDRLFVIGGWGENDSSTTMEYYDEIKGEWFICGGRMNLSRVHGGAIVMDNNIFIVGGATLHYGKWLSTPTVEVYNHEKQVWKLCASLSYVRVGHVRLCILNDSIVCGGEFGKPSEIYDPCENVWREFESDIFGDSIVGTCDEKKLLCDVLP